MVNLRKLRGLKNPAAIAARAARIAAKSAARAAAIARNLPAGVSFGDFSLNLAVGDAQRSVDFYTQALGYVLEHRLESEGGLVGALLRSGKSTLGVRQEERSAARARPRGEGFHVWSETTQDLDELARRVVAHGGRILEGPVDKPRGARSVTFEDPDGYQLTYFRGGKA